MNHQPTAAPGILLTLYGRPTCEDTAITRDRLCFLGVPFHEIDITQDDDAMQFVQSINGGNQVTPTLMIVPTSEVLAEPGVRALDEALYRAGVSVVRPRVSEYLGPSADRPLLDFSLPAVSGERFRLSDQRGRVKTILFFAADHGCLACAGYARQLAAPQDLYAETGSQLVVVLTEDRETTGHWATEYVPGTTVLADAGGVVKQRVAAYLEQDRNAVLAVVLDRYTAPRVVTAAPTPGGLLPPQELLEWLQYLDYECAE